MKDNIRKSIGNWYTYSIMNYLFAQAFTVTPKISVRKEAVFGFACNALKNELYAFEGDTP